MDWSLMPEGCISHVLSLTSPRDTCVLAVISAAFRSAADADFVWEQFLPQDYRDIVSSSVHPVHFSSKKDLYFQLCRPILVDGGRKSFVLEKSTGKKCFLISARKLDITWGHDSRYWRWVSTPDSRFEAVAELISVCWLHITGSLTTADLSPDTTYVSYLIFKLREDSYGLDFLEQKASIRIRDQHSTKTLSLMGRETASRPRFYNRERNRNRNPVQNLFAGTEENNHIHTPYVVREDGWFEIDMGEFFNEGVGSEEEQVVVRLAETEHLNWKSGLVIEGTEVRPKK